MDNKTQARLEARARVIRALAHPSRLFFIEQLSRGELCVCELTRMVGADISTVSKHLSLLKAAGIVQDRKRGAQVYYHLKGDRAFRFAREVDDMLLQLAEQQVEILRAPLAS